jgi:hypothetical protein
VNYPSRTQDFTQRIPKIYLFKKSIRSQRRVNDLMCSVVGPCTGISPCVIPIQSCARGCSRTTFARRRCQWHTQAQLTWGCQRLNPIFLFTFRYSPSSIQGCSHRHEVINRYGCGGAWEHLHLRLAGELLKDAEGRRRSLGSVSPIFNFFVRAL